MLCILFKNTIKIQKYTDHSIKNYIDSGAPKWDSLYNYNIIQKILN